MSRRAGAPRSGDATGELTQGRRQSTAVVLHGMTEAAGGW